MTVQTTVESEGLGDVLARLPTDIVDRIWAALRSYVE